MTSLAEEYRRQRAFRDFARVLDALPDLRGRTVLDLGCGIGDQAAALAERGARVIAVDRDADLLEVARARCHPRVELVQADLAALPDLGPVDGVWCSFAVAYFPDLGTVLQRWLAPLRRGGFVALTEIDDLLGHEPLARSSRELLDAYASAALTAGRYDFRMGRKLADHLRSAGTTVVRQLTLDDRELAFDGAAEPEVLAAWRERLERMRQLAEFCGDAFAGLKRDFLGCLADSEHRARATVVCCIAERS